MPWNVIPGLGEAQVEGLRAEPVADAREDAERALLQAIAAHARASLAADGDPTASVGRAALLTQSVAVLRASARAGGAGDG